MPSRGTCLIEAAAEFRHALGDGHHRTQRTQSLGLAEKEDEGDAQALQRTLDVGIGRIKR